MIYKEFWKGISYLMNGIWEVDKRSLDVHIILHNDILHLEKQLIFLAHIPVG